MWCSACENKLGDPEEELHDPEGEFIPDLGVIENPNSHHIKVVYGEKGQRLQCSNTGQMTKLVEEPPDKESEGETKGGPSGTGGQPKKQPKQEGEIYDTEKEKTAKDILMEVVNNPAYDLNDQQVAEVDDWAEIYDYQIPPNTLQDVLQNMSGISKQKAKLMRQKYEAKLNKWIQTQSSGDSGPSIGAMAGPSMPQNNNPSIDAPTPSKTNEGAPHTPEPSTQQRTPEPEREPKSRRGRRKNRRDEVIDKVADEMAKNVAEDVGTFYSDMRSVMTTVLKRKAEKDPDWFLEKVDEFGVDIIDELSEPSQAKKEEMQGQSSAPNADAEVDAALEEMMTGGSVEEPRKQQRQPEQQETRQEPQEPREPPSQAEHPMEGSPGGLEEFVEDEKESADGEKTPEELEFEKTFKED